MSRPEVSVVIPTRNRLPLLREAVNSVLEQEGVAVECIAVDDHSDDGTLEWLSAIGDDRLSFVRLESHVERSAARNAGLRRSLAPFVLFLDDDDLLTSTALRRQLAKLQANPDAGLCIGRWMQIDESGERRLPSFPRARRPTHFVRASVLGVEFRPGQCLFRRSTLEGIGGWNENMTVAEDQDLLMRMSLVGPLVLAPQVTYVNRRHDGQEKSREDSIPAAEARQSLRRTVGPPLDEQVDRYLGVRRRLLDSYDSYRAGSPFRALGQVLGALALDPGGLMDPLTRRGVLTFMLRCMVRCVPGSYATARAARLTSASSNDQ